MNVLTCTYWSGLSTALLIAIASIASTTAVAEINIEFRGEIKAEPSWYPSDGAYAGQQDSFLHVETARINGYATPRVLINLGSVAAQRAIPASISARPM